MHLILDYGLGNLASIKKAVERAGLRAGISRDSRELAGADSIILPGVGSFREAMQRLELLDLPGLLEDLVLGQGKRCLGICLGMQLMAEWGNEDGRVRGLGWIAGEVKRIAQPSGRLPHMGWNDIALTSKGARDFPALPDKDFYFMHSYHFDAVEPELITSTVDYGITLAASLRKGNIVAAQFHPEKSQAAGLAFLKYALGAEC